MGVNVGATVSTGLHAWTCNIATRVPGLSTSEKIPLYTINFAQASLPSFRPPRIKITHAPRFFRMHSHTHSTTHASFNHWQHCTHSSNASSGSSILVFLHLCARGILSVSPIMALRAAVLLRFELTFMSLLLLYLATKNPTLSTQ